MTELTRWSINEIMNWGSTGTERLYDCDEVDELLQKLRAEIAELKTEIERLKSL